MFQSATPDESPTALVAEDEPHLGVLLQYNLAAAGYMVEVCTDGNEAALRLQARPFDLVILDWNLPAVSGLQLLRQIRTSPSTCASAVILLTARMDDADRAYALATGADAYMTKPFSLEELRERIAVLRRPAAPGNRTRAAAALEFDPLSRVVRSETATATLNPAAFRLLELFIERSGRPMSRRERHQLLWGPYINVDERSIDVMVERLRAALATFNQRNAIKHGPSFHYRLE